MNEGEPYDPQAVYEALLRKRLALACKHYMMCRPRSHPALEAKGLAQGLATAIALLEDPNQGYGRTLDAAMKEAAS